MTAQTQAGVGAEPTVMRIGRARLTAGLDRFSWLDLNLHQQVFGSIRRLTARQLIDMAEQVDLRGRGGAAFPFARKLRAVTEAAAARRPATAVLVNGTEGEPGSAKDSMLLCRWPYLVLSGALLAHRRPAGDGAGHLRRAAPGRRADRRVPRHVAVG